MTNASYREKTFLFVKHFQEYDNAFDSSTLGRKDYYTHFTDGKTKAARLNEWL